jgi:hypothetical protein
MADKKKWAQDVDLKEGALSKIGWPSAQAIVGSISSGKVDYPTAQRRLSFLANVTKDPSTKRKAQAIIVRVRNQFGKEKKK